MEMLDIVDDNDQVIDQKPRSEVEKNVLRHRVARIIVKNSQNQLLVQKRSKNKKMYPSHWDLGVAGTVQAGESYEQTASRELQEEAGITYDISQDNFLFKIQYDSDVDSKFSSIFEIEHDGDVKNEDGEVEILKFISHKEVADLTKQNFHPVGKIVFEKYNERAN